MSGHRWLSKPAPGALGKYTLGIYAVHMVFVDLLALPGLYFHSPLWNLAVVGLVLPLSLGAVALMARSRLWHALSPDLF